MHLLLPLLVLVVSCGNPSPAPWAGPELILQMPAALAKDSQRYRRFLARASHLVLKVKSPNAPEFSQTFPVETWERLSLPTAAPPLEVTVEIWDRNREGHLRRDPALRGQGKWTADTPSLRLKLRLELSPREYD